jgi:hypothetical protein
MGAMTGLKMELCILVLLALITVTVPAGTHSEPAQPSPTNNVLYLHYNDTSSKGWLNTDKCDTVNDSFSCQAGGWERSGYYIFLNFTLRPALQYTNCLILDNSQEWIARLHLFDFRNMKFDTSITAGNMTKAPKDWSSDGPVWTFWFAMGIGNVTPNQTLNFTIAIYIQGYIGYEPPYLLIYFDEESNLTLPITGADIDTDGDAQPNSQDPDDDNDGHNDTNDAYPMDVTRWAKPETAKPAPTLWYALPAVVILAVLAAVYLRRRLRGKSGRLADPYNR